MLENNLLVEPEEIQTPEQYAAQSEINDMRQHANKIINGIKKLNQHDAVRAIWELFQNAVDLSREAHIEINLTLESLEFSHYGEPFTPMTLDCLFKQVSSKTLDEKKEVALDEDPVGQYGSGFITSHVFSKELYISGCIKRGSGYLPLNDFIIDRRTDNWKILANAIRVSKNKVTELLGAENVALEGIYPKTTFRYVFSNEQNRKAAEQAIASLPLILPYVMTLNPNLTKVEVRDLEAKTFSYRKDAPFVHEDMMVSRVFVNEVPQEICLIQTTDKKTTIVLPINKNYQAQAFDKALPRLFLYYPLIGSEEFGMNFIMHSRQFQPLEDRDGLFLNSDNEATIKEEKQNRLLLENASARLFEFLKLHTDKIKAKIHLAEVNFKINGDEELLNDYFIGLKTRWLEVFKSLPLVESTSGSISASLAAFLAPEILAFADGFEKTYPMAAKFHSDMPKQDLVEEWTKKVAAWGMETINFISLNNVVGDIEGAANLKDFDVKALQSFYQFLINSGNEAFFQSRKLLPNIYGDFRLLSGNDGLSRSLDISSDLLRIAEVIMPEVPRRIIDADFSFSLELADYSRRNFSTDLLAVLGTKPADTAGSDLEEEFLRKLVDYCKISTVEDSTAIPLQMTRSVAEFYGLEENLIMIPKAEGEDLEIRSAQIRLVRMMLHDLKEKDATWVSERVLFLKKLLKSGGGDGFKEMFQSMSVYPNQLYELCEQSRLSIDDSIPKEVKDLYDLVIKPELPIRASLVHDDFFTLLFDKRLISAKDLSQKIERVFFGESNAINIDEHEYRSQILSIVDKFKDEDDEGYKIYYPLIYSKRSEIMVSLADGTSSFTILSMHPDKIKGLAALGSDPDYERIVELGRQAVLNKKQDEADFDRKYMLGRHMEKVLRAGLEDLLKDRVTARVEDVQNGQDIVVRLDGNIIYYIEVKSRWGLDNPVRLSKNQTTKAFEMRDKYALCAVDLVGFEGDALNVEKVNELDGRIYFIRDIGDKVEHLIEILELEKDAERINLDGDYRTRVPMSVVYSGEDLKSFEHFLMDLLTKNLSLSA